MSKEVSFTLSYIILFARNFPKKHLHGISVYWSMNHGRTGMQTKRGTVNFKILNSVFLKSNYKWINVHFHLLFFKILMILHLLWLYYYFLFLNLFSPFLKKMFYNLLTVRKCFCSFSESCHDFLMLFMFLCFSSLS